MRSFRAAVAAVLCLFAGAAWAEEPFEIFPQPMPFPYAGCSAPEAVHQGAIEMANIIDASIASMTNPHAKTFSDGWRTRARAPLIDVDSIILVISPKELTVQTVEFVGNCAVTLTTLTVRQWAIITGATPPKARGIGI